MGAMDEMMEAMIGSMSKEERMEMMGAMMEKFFADLTVEDRQGLMEQMMPRMMEGINMMEMMPRMMMGMMGGGQTDSGTTGDSGSAGGMTDMMARMGGGGQGNSGMMDMMARMMGGGCTEMPMMPDMMNQMMPHCLNMMLPGIPTEQRVDFVLDMIGTLVEQGSSGMSDEEKDAFRAKIFEKVSG